jgi:hypothetical protein
MIARLPAGWQTTIADLALILFIVTAAAIDGQPSPAEKASAETAAPPASGEPLAVYRAGDGVPPLGQWLAEQAPDSRQYLTIVARYRAGDAARTAERALALAEEARGAGVAARIVLEPGEGEDVLATLAFDRPDLAVARSVH